MTPPIIFGILLALVDVIVLAMLKMRHDGTIKTNSVFLLAFIIYGCQSIIFYKSLDYGSMIQMNLIWDLTSDILVTIIGLCYFKEATSTNQKIGIFLGILSLLLLKRGNM